MFDSSTSDANRPKDAQRERTVDRTNGFEAVDADELDDSREFWIQPIGAGVLFLAMTASSVYAIWYDLDALSVAGLEVALLDWLYVLGLSFVLVVMGPGLVAERGRVRRILGRLGDRPLVALAGCYVVVLFLVASLYPLFVPEPDLDLLYSIQPPAWASIPEPFVASCHGSTVDGQCTGTIEYPLGTNFRGQDLVTVGLLGLNTTLQVAVSASVLSVSLGVLVGTVAGYAGGRTDELLTRYVDLQRAFPAFFVYVLLIFVFSRSYALLILVFGLLSWGDVARLVRSEVIQLRETPFVQAARLSGARPRFVLVRHIVPNTSNTILPAAAVLFSKFVVYEASLAFLTLTDLSVVSLGNEIAISVGRESADPILPAEGAFLDWWAAPWTVLVPAGILSSFLLAVSVCSDGLRDALDPR